MPKNFLASASTRIIQWLPRICNIGNPVNRACAGYAAGYRYDFRDETHPPEFTASMRRYAGNLNRHGELAFTEFTHMGSMATPEPARTEEPYAVIAAARGSPVMPGIPGIDGKNVMQTLEAFDRMDEVGESVALIGGGFVGTERDTPGRPRQKGRHNRDARPDSSGGQHRHGDIAL